MLNDPAWQGEHSDDSALGSVPGLQRLGKKLIEFEAPGEVRPEDAITRTFTSKARVEEVDTDESSCCTKDGFIEHTSCW